MVQVLGKRVRYWCGLSSNHYVAIVLKEMAKKPYVYKVQLLNDSKAVRYIGEGQITEIYEDGEPLPEEIDGNDG